MNYNHTGVLLASGDFDKSPGSPTVGLKLVLVQLQFCICPSLMCMEVALAVICQWLIRCGQIPSPFSSAGCTAQPQLCIYRKMAVLGGEAALFTCNINTVTSTRATTHTHMQEWPAGKRETRSDMLLVGAGFMHRRMNKQARGPTPGVCYVEEKSHLSCHRCLQQSTKSPVWSVDSRERPTNILKGQYVVLEKKFKHRNITVGNNTIIE